MKSVEQKVSSISDYYVFSPSRTAQEMFLYPLQCGLFTYDPGYTLKRSSFDSFLLMYIQKGTMLLDLNGRQQPVSDKHFVLIDCYQPHGYSTREGYECLWMHFDGVLARGYYELIVSRLKNVFVMEDPFPVLRKMNTILKTFEMKLQEDSVRADFEKELERLEKSGEAATPDEAVVKAAKTVMGLDINLTELEKERAAVETVDPEELALVSGGEHCNRCLKDYTCHIAWEHPDETDRTDACWWNYVCYGIYKCTKASN